MGLFSFLRGGSKPETPESNYPRADAVTFLNLSDPALLDLLRDGRVSAAGPTVSVEAALRNPAVFRSVSLLAQTIGMLPLHLINKETKEKARDHALFPILHRRPNAWQTAYDFRMLMQLRVLVERNAYALIIRSPVRPFRILRLVPLDPDKVQPKLGADWVMRYEYRPSSGGVQHYPAEEIFHLRGLSLDGVNGMSLVEQAADTIGLAIAAELAASRLFKNGSFIPGTLNSPKSLGREALIRLREAWDARFSGIENAGKTPVLEEGLEYKVLGMSAKDMQHNELRARQVEDIARIFGVPRPLLMVDETSWGSGIEALGQFFVRYGLNPWFEAWQQAIERSLLSEEDADRYEAKFNDGALTRGSLKDQADYFAKALGAGGHQPWMTPNQVREVLDMPPHEDGDSLTNPMMGHNGGPALSEA